DSPIGNLDFADAAILAELNHRNPAARIFHKSDKHFVGRERPWNHFCNWLGVVWEPKRGRGAGGGLLSDLLGKDRGAKSALSERNGAGESRRTAADNRDSRSHLPSPAASLNGSMICRNRYSAPRKRMLAATEIHLPIANS